MVRNETSNPENLTDQAYFAIRDDVISHVILPGAVISETQLASQYGIGKTPVREALVKLHREGLVSPRPRKGYEVAPLTLSHVQQLFHVRTLLEPAAVRLAASRPRQDHDLAYLEDLDALCRVEVDNKDRASIAAFLRANSALHVGVAAASGNAVLASMLQDILIQLDRYVHLALMLSTRPGGYAHEHSDLINAVRMGDQDRASELALEQIRWSEQAVITALMATATIQSTNIRA